MCVCVSVCVCVGGGGKQGVQTSRLQPHFFRLPLFHPFSLRVLSIVSIISPNSLFPPSLHRSISSSSSPSFPPPLPLPPFVLPGSSPLLLSSVDFTAKKPRRRKKKQSCCSYSKMVYNIMDPDIMHEASFKRTICCISPVHWQARARLSFPVHLKKTRPLYRAL